MTKYFTFDALKRAIQTAKKYALNRTLNAAFFRELDQTQVYPISFSMPHNADHMRVRFVHNEHGAETSGAWLDMTFEDYESLPSA